MASQKTIRPDKSFSLQNLLEESLTDRGCAIPKFTNCWMPKFQVDDDLKTHDIEGIADNENDVFRIFQSTNNQLGFDNPHL
jgi:hypothetical protein